MNAATKHLVVPAAVVVTTAAVLSLLWSVPYLYTLLGFSAWAFFGHLVTIDDDVPGGWANPDGARPVPWGELATKGAVFAALGVTALAFPSLRELGR